MERFDFKWIWAAYRKQSFSQEMFEYGLERIGFEERLNEVLQTYNEWFLVSVDKPVGLVAIMTDGYRFDPTVFWFKWATTRQKLEAFGKFLHAMRQDGMVGVLYVDQGGAKLLDHIAQRGIVRRVGPIYDFFGFHRHANLYQTSRRDLM